MRLPLPVSAGLVAACLLGCGRPASAPSGTGARYVVGTGYQAGGIWFYPREDFQYDQTGLATVMQARHGVTADGEAADAARLTAAHQTLQLPALAWVTNLETGRQALVRINDRGPASAARLIALSPPAARLLGISAEGTARVRVQVDEGRSLALRGALHGGPQLAMTAVPRDKVTAEDLPPPAGVVQPMPKRSARPALATVGAAKDMAAAPDSLPETARTVAPRPGRLMIEAGSFGQAVYARQAQTRLAGLGARIDRSGDGRDERYAVRAGPYGSVAAADAALDQAFQAGVTDARIIVQ